MSSLQKFVIANWKMYFSYHQAVAWCIAHKEELLHVNSSCTLTICPSYEVIAALQLLLGTTKIKIGAQNCSEHEAGAYTGQIMARSLKEIGVAYCIVGHSEVRSNFHDSHVTLKRKLNQLLEQAIVPIFCIGETLEEYQKGVTTTILRDQLRPLLEVAHDYGNKSLTFLIAYEPIWAIGTGIVANNEAINHALEYCENLVSSNSKNHSFYYLYGGTVTSATIVELKKISRLQGFLIGKASTDFQELKKIVSLL